MRWLPIVLVVASVQAAPRTQVVQGTSGSRSDNLTIHAGGLVLREGEPGSAFGTIAAGKMERQLSYFVIFKHRMGVESPLDHAEESTAEDLVGSSKQTLRVDDKSLEVEYQVRLDATSRKISRETLTVNGKSVDVARGRVLLVDLTTNPPRWEQRKLDLPTKVGETTSKKAAEELVRRVLTGAIKKDRKVKEFTEAARR